MLNGKAKIVLLIVRLIKKTYINEWIFFRTKIFRRKSESWIRVELDLSSCAEKTNLKNATDVDTSALPKITDLAYSKSDLDKLDIGKLKNVPTNLNLI